MKRKGLNIGDPAASSGRSSRTIGKSPPARELDLLSCSRVGWKEEEIALLLSVKDIQIPEY